MSTKKKKSGSGSPFSSSRASRKNQSPLLLSDPAGYIKKSYPLLEKAYGEVHCALHFQKPHELAIAVILSAQCTDEQVNRVTPALFERYPEPQDYYRAPLSELEGIIYSTGFYHNKARNIQGFTRQLVELHGGEIPRELAALVKMPGVGRKTANVILQELFEIPSGVVVDTHVSRLSRVQGLTDQKDPVRIERVLLEIIPEACWINWSLYMIRLGRTVCTARKRTCSECPIRKVCPSSTTNPSGTGT